MHRGKANEEHDATNSDWQGNGPPGEAGRGEGVGVYMAETGREKKIPLGGRTLGLTGN